MITIPYPGGLRAGPIAIAVADPLLRALIALSNEEGAEIQLDRLL